MQFVEWKEKILCPAGKGFLYPAVVLGLFLNRQ